MGYKKAKEGLSDENYYAFILDVIQHLCRESGIYPCILDAAIFTSYDKDECSEDIIPCCREPSDISRVPPPTSDLFSCDSLVGLCSLIVQRLSSIGTLSGLAETKI